MAGDWIKVEKDTPEKPEVLALASLLSIPIGEAFLACFKLWRWADSQTVDGCALRVTTASLDALCGLPGFADALREVGWLQVRNGSLEVPNFARHMGQPAKARALTAARMQRRRTPVLPKSDVPNVTKPSPEKRREEKSKKKNPPVVPPALDSPEFRASWSRWEQHRRELRKPLTPSTATAQLAKLAKAGPVAAVAAIEESIRQGWTGLFPEHHVPADKLDPIREFLSRGEDEPCDQT